MPSDLERLRARLVDERTTADAMSDHALASVPAGHPVPPSQLGRHLSFAGRARGLSTAIRHIDIMLSVIAEEQSEPTENLKGGEAPMA